MVFRSLKKMIFQILLSFAVFADAIAGLLKSMNISHQIINFYSIAPSEKFKLLPRAPVCGPDSQDRIYGGSDTRIDEFPWTVLVEMMSRDKKF